MYLRVCLLAWISLAAAQRRTEWPDGGNYRSPSGDDGAAAGKGDVGGDGGEGGSGGSGGPQKGSGGLDGPGKAKEPFDLALNSANIGHFANIPESYLLSVPEQNLARLRPKVIHTLPLTVRDRVEQEEVKKSIALIKVLSSLNEGKFKKMPWGTLIQQVPPGALNNMDPSRLNAIDWNQAMPNVSPEMMYQLTPRTLYFIPAEAWQHVSVEAFQTIDPRALSLMEVNSLKQIPRGHWDSLDPEFLAALPKDKLYAIDPALLVAAAGAANPPLPPLAGEAAEEPAVPAGEPAPGAEPGADGADGGAAGGGSGNCDDLTLAELTQKVALGELSFPCRRRLQKLTRARVFAGRQRQRS